MITATKELLQVEGGLFFRFVNVRLSESTYVIVFYFLVFVVIFAIQ